MGRRPLQLLVFFYVLSAVALTWWQADLRGGIEVGGTVAALLLAVPVTFVLVAGVGILAPRRGRGQPPRRRLTPAPRRRRPTPPSGTTRARRTTHRR
ncbi:MAG: hypothetical protein JHC95_15580 [Solirubrobacteraceae bacterium]|nr:hypothetical protein [Solirubrobacteraceae bacterium]